MAKEKPDVWFPLMVSAYLKKTMGLNAEQHGAYLLLLISYWVDGPPIDDDAWLASITRMQPAQWRRTRPIMLHYFYVEDGRWRQERADEELARWAERKRKFAERAAAGGKAKAARNSASSTPKALLTGFPPSPSGEVEGPYSPSTLTGQNEFLGPKEVRAAFLAKLGEDWCGSYLDPCTWQDMPVRGLIPATGPARDKLRQDAWRLLKELGLSVLERAA